MGTESDSRHENLEQKDFWSILSGMNEEDQSVAIAVKKCLTAIERLCEQIYSRMSDGGRLFYIGAGTSGRLGVLDASECPPTFGVPQGLVVGLIAGGDSAIRKAVEFAEDDSKQAWKDLKAYDITSKDVVVGIAASGKTPYVIGGVETCKDHGILTGCITCNDGSALAQSVDHPIEVLVGPEYITGSTRLKSGTAQKMVLNMITTSVMIKLGHVVGNRMVDMQLSNDKLIDRGARFVMEATQLNYAEAKMLLVKEGSVRKAIDNHSSGSTSANK